MLEHDVQYNATMMQGKDNVTKMTRPLLVKAIDTTC